MSTALLIIKTLMYLASKLVGGYSIRYYNSRLSDVAKERLLTLHGMLSFGFGFGLTNNLLSDFQFFSTRFAENSLWIILTGLIVMILVSILTGSLITALVEVKHSRKKISDYES